MARNAPKFFLGLESVRAGNGGICRVARLIARVLAEEQKAGQCEVNGVVLSDAARAQELGLSLKLAKGSRTKFVGAVNGALFGSSHFIYDCGGMARGHQWLPLPRRPSLVFIHGIEVWPGTLHAKQFRAIVRANLVVSNSNYTRVHAAAAELASAQVCWLATEQDDAPETAHARAGPPRVLILARLDDSTYKGHAELIRCWPAVRAAVSDAVLTIAGTGPGAGRYKRMGEETGLPADSIEFRGFVPEERLPDLWDQTTLFAMPSRGEGFGLVYIEAMRHGVPVIGSVHDAAPEVNIDGVTGYNVSLDKQDELPDRIIRLLRDRDLAAKLGANGAVRWAEHFRYSAFRERFLRILRNWTGG